MPYTADDRWTFCQIQKFSFKIHNSLSTRSQYWRIICLISLMKFTYSLLIQFFFFLFFHVPTTINDSVDTHGSHTGTYTFLFHYETGNEWQHFSWRRKSFKCTYLMKWFIELRNNKFDRLNANFQDQKYINFWSLIPNLGTKIAFEISNNHIILHIWRSGFLNLLFIAFFRCFHAD